MKTHHSILKLITTLTVASLILSGCSSMNNLFGKHDNGSLDYQKSKLLAPVQIPIDKQTQAFTPLYPRVDLGESQIKLTNEQGKQYHLPAPKRVIN